MVPLISECYSFLVPKLVFYIPEQLVTAPQKHENRLSGKTETRHGPSFPGPLVMFTWNCRLGTSRLVCGGGLYLGRLGWRENGRKVSPVSH